MTECKHKYVDMEDGIHDKFCVRCGRKFKQALLGVNSEIMPSNTEIKVNINLSREVKNMDDSIQNVAKEIAKNLKMNSMHL